MLRAVKLLYHQFIEGVYSPQFENILYQSPTNEDMIQNAGRLEKICQALMSHTQAIVELTPEGSAVHEEATKRLDVLQRTYEKTQQYKKIEELTKRMFGNRTL